MPRRHRFPLYAPEPIERRLNPSPVVFPASPVAAEIAPTPRPIPPAPKPVPVPEPGDPPITDPNSPIGPALPA